MCLIYFMEQVLFDYHPQSCAASQVVTSRLTFDPN